MINGDPRSAGRRASVSGGNGTADGIELWGRRIGRTLSLFGCIALAIYLYLAYVR
jgi:hypothetical protein